MFNSARPGYFFESSAALLLTFFLVAPLSAQVNDLLPGSLEGVTNTLVEPTSWRDRSSCFCEQCDDPCCSSGCCHAGASRFRISELNIYPTFSYLGDDAATYTEFELASFTDFGCWEMENRTVLNVADLPSTISLGPSNPSGGPGAVNIRASGFGDILSGFFFSRTDVEHDWHLGVGPVFTFPSASDEILGSGKWTVGPGAHFHTDIGRLNAGFFLWQSWSFAGPSSQKTVNQLFGKPFFIYELNERWNLVYVPLGMSYSWNGKSGERWTVPLGGGLRRLCHIGEQKVGLQFQAFSYVARKSKDPEWELRATIEFLFD